MSSSRVREITVKSWEEFEARFADLKSAEEKAKRQTSSLLFRGQRDSSWRLETTLERAAKEPMSVSQYYRLMSVAHAQVETFTDNRWTLPSFPEVDEALRQYDTMRRAQFPDDETYRYMIYLRHHGFPSPLLDWSQSYRVAGFFAFREQSVADHVSLYVFSEMPLSFKAGSSSDPRIHRTGPYIRSHRRHFLQQSEYTMCVEFKDGKTWFAPHVSVFERGDPDQDVLWKFNIPSSERRKVLAQFDEFNLNAFSLFGSEESLMETLAVREFLLT